MKNIVDEILESIPSYEKRANRISNDISAQIYEYMKEKNINQRQLAEKLGKKESEISKWLNGNHNFTIETIAKIEEIFNNKIILVPIYVREDLNIEYESSYFKAFADLTTKIIKNYEPKPAVARCLDFKNEIPGLVPYEVNQITSLDCNVTYPLKKTGTDN